MEDVFLLQYASVFVFLVIQLGLEKGAVIPQLVVLTPVLLCLLKRATSTGISLKSKTKEQGGRNQGANLEGAATP